MKIKKIILFYVFYTVNALAFSQPSLQPPALLSPVNHQKFMGIDLQQCAQYQQLTSTQKSNVDRIVDEYKKEVAPLKEQLKTVQQVLEAQLAQREINEQMVHDLVNRISNLRSQIFAIGIQMKIRMIKNVGFNSASCLKPTSPELCPGNVCIQPVPQQVVSPPKKNSSSDSLWP